MMANTVNIILDTSNGAIVDCMNCTFDSSKGVLSFIDDDRNCSFKVQPFNPGMAPQIKTGNYTMPESADFIMLEAHENYSDITIDFIAANDDDFCDYLLS